MKDVSITRGSNISESGQLATFWLKDFVDGL